MLFSIRHGVIVEGPNMKHAWAPDASCLKHVDGKTFFTIRKNDRGFANVIGLNLSQRSPWEGITFLDFALALRNERVDKIIMDLHIDSADPLAEAVADPVIKKLRKELMEGVPHSIILTFPPWAHWAPTAFVFALRRQETTILTLNSHPATWSTFLRLRT